VKVTRERIEEKAPPEVADYETDADWCYLAFRFDFGDERYGVRIFDSDPEVADVLKETPGPYDDDRLAQIKNYLVKHAGVRTILTLHGTTGGFAEWVP
jgi:hypothetical protein